MTNDNHARRVAEALVIGASLSLVKTAGWTIQKYATVALPKAFWNYLYVSEPLLLLVPTIEDPAKLRSAVGTAVRKARSDALVVTLGQTARGERQALMRICMWSALGVHWYGPHLPWLSSDNEIWLVPDPSAPVDEQPSFRMVGSHLAPSAAPFSKALDRARGFASARSLIEQALEG
jgi:hypothetical protein